MTLTRDFLKAQMDYINHKLNRPQRLVLGGGAGDDGGTGIPAGGVIGQLSQKYICYDTTEATTAGSTATGGSNPSLLHNLNRIRGGWAIGDDAIVERHLLWSTGCLAGTSGCIDAYHIPFYGWSVPDGNARDAIEWVYAHRADAGTAYIWQTVTFTHEGDLEEGIGDLRWASPCTMTIDHVYGTLGTAPQGQDAIIDVNKNAVTILDGSKLTFATGGSIATGTVSVTTLEENDILTMDIDQRGTTTPGSDMVVHVRCRQQWQEV